MRKSIKNLKQQECWFSSIRFSFEEFHVLIKQKSFWKSKSLVNILGTNMVWIKTRFHSINDHEDYRYRCFDIYDTYNNVKYAGLIIIMPWQCHIWRLPLHIEKNTWVKSWAKAGCHTCQKYEYKYKWEYNHKYKHEWQRRRKYWKQKSPKIDKEKYKNT